MLRIADRVYVAMGNGLGIQLSATEVAQLAEILVHVNTLTETRHNATQASQAERGIIAGAKKLFKGV